MGIKAMSDNWKVIEQVISDSINSPFTIKNKTVVSGGCINSAFKVHDDEKKYFVKTNDAELLEMFEAEFQGLADIQHSSAISVPTPICTGLANDTAFIVLEYLNIGPSSKPSMDTMAEQLAAMHRSQQASYGWSRDNTIGSTIQINTQMDNWLDFWQQHRLGFQLELAGQNGYRGSLQKKGDKLMEKMPGLFFDELPSASLLHGDLWSGNMAVLESGVPVIFDPAVYYGDRETDIAMTELFGGFSDDFYRSYNEHYPLSEHYATRKIFYNSYHILNHLNLFGGGYGQQAESMMDRVLSELG